jgi:hypothetical protein
MLPPTQDIEFIVTNKVTHVINTVSKAVPNLYERFGVQYLSVHWTEREENVGFDLPRSSTRRTTRSTPSSASWRRRWSRARAA